MHFSSIIITNTGWLLDKPRERARAKTHSGPRRLICIIVSYSFVLLKFRVFFLLVLNCFLPNTISFLTIPYFLSIHKRVYSFSAVYLWVDDAGYTRLYHILVLSYSMVCTCNVVINPSITVNSIPRHWKMNDVSFFFLLLSSILIGRIFSSRGYHYRFAFMDVTISCNVNLRVHVYVYVSVYVCVYHNHVWLVWTPTRIQMVKKSFESVYNR